LACPGSTLRLTLLDVTRKYGVTGFREEINRTTLDGTWNKM